MGEGVGERGKTERKRRQLLWRELRIEMTGAKRNESRKSMYVEEVI